MPLIFRTLPVSVTTYAFLRLNATEVGRSSGADDRREPAVAIHAREAAGVRRCGRARVRGVVGQREDALRERVQAAIEAELDVGHQRGAGRDLEWRRVRQEPEHLAVLGTMRHRAGQADEEHGPPGREAGGHDVAERLQLAHLTVAPDADDAVVVPVGDQRTRPGTAPARTGRRPARKNARVRRVHRPPSAPMSATGVTGPVPVDAVDPLDHVGLRRTWGRRCATST